MNIGIWTLTRFVWSWVYPSYKPLTREHGDALLGATPYHEVAAQPVFMVFLQRIVNGGGHVDREYGVGRGRVDLLVRWPYRLPKGRSAVQRRAIEIKVWRPQSPIRTRKGWSSRIIHRPRRTLVLCRRTLHMTPSEDLAQ